MRAGSKPTPASRSPAAGFIAPPDVGADGGKRAVRLAGTLPPWIRPGAPLPGLEILPYTKVNRIVLAQGGRARAVQYTNRGALDQMLPVSLEPRG